jgi:predicted ATP-dependent serine protease
VFILCCRRYIAPLLCLCAPPNIGEVGLAGELRPASHMESRVLAAQQAGIGHCVVAATGAGQVAALAARAKKLGG